MEKKTKNQVGIAISTFVALFVLVVIQVLFLIRSGKLEERHFNHRVVLALREARNAIVQEAYISNNVHNYVCGNDCAVGVQDLGFQKVDSIIKSNLRLNRINLAYNFEFINDGGNLDEMCKMCYAQSLNGMFEQTGIKLQIEFPDYSKFLVAQMGVLFYLSMIAIMFVMISFIFTYRLYSRNQLLLENIKSFIDNMVHEFQTPIANIKLASNLLLKKTSVKDEKNIEFLKLIQKENKKLNTHVNDILNVVPLKAEEKNLQSVNIHEVLSECENDFQVRFKQKGGYIKMNLRADKFLIFGNAGDIKHAFMNLIDNAYKYVKGNPELCISTYNKKDWIWIEFADNGIGFPSSEYKSIFEKYYRIQRGNVHDNKGFGLGLNIVKGVVDKFDGRIIVSSKENQGSVFLMQFRLIDK